jgi:hypothetical protein
VIGKAEIVLCSMQAGAVLWSLGCRTELRWDCDWVASLIGVTGWTTMLQWMCSAASMRFRRRAGSAHVLKTRTLRIPGFEALIVSQACGAMAI